MYRQQLNCRFTYVWSNWDRGGLFVWENTRGSLLLRGETRREAQRLRPLSETTNHFHVNQSLIKQQQHKLDTSATDEVQEVTESVAEREHREQMQWTEQLTLPPPPAAFVDLAPTPRLLTTMWRTSLWVKQTFRFGYIGPDYTIRYNFIAYKIVGGVIR